MSKKHISFSQFSQWSICPWRWKLLYIDGLKIKPSIHLLFGTAMHEVLQKYLYTMYNESVRSAENLDLNSFLKERMIILYDEKKEEHKDEINKYIKKQEMVEFYYDGEKIITWFKKHRLDFFNTKTEELVGVEVPINLDIKNNLEFEGFLDVVIKNKITEKIKIIDLKTSTKGWKDYQKRDENKTSQLVIYKSFYSKKYNTPIDKIDVEFLILKRKMYELSQYPQKRIQRFVPASGIPTINKNFKKMDVFVNQAYTKDGEHNIDGIFPKIPTSFNCRYCNFDKLCDKKS